jgi:hypothetical protein
MNNASPRPTFPFSFPAMQGGGLAPLSVLNVEPDDFEATFLPVGDAHPAADSQEFGGFFIGIGLAVPAGLLIWALVVSAIIAINY